MLTKPWNEWNKGPPIPFVEKELLSKIKCGLVLDLGCGTGRGIARFKSYGWESVGVDVVLQTQRILGVGNFVKADAQFLPFQDETFDAIMIAQVLHHIPQPRLVLSESKRCLKRNGFMLIGENIEDNYLLKFSRSLYPSHDGMKTICDYSRFKRNDLKRLILDSGFVILKEATGVVIWIFWYELAKRLAILRPLSLFIKRIDNILEKLLPPAHTQYYCLCAKATFL